MSDEIRVKSPLYFNGHYFLFYCPGCELLHGVWPQEYPNPLTGASWAWNNSHQKPTFSPSLLIAGDPPRSKRCHLFIEDGKIRYLDDCDHRLAGCTIPMIDDPMEQF